MKKAQSLSRANNFARAAALRIIHGIARHNTYSVDANTFASWYFPANFYVIAENHSGAASSYQYVVNAQTGYGYVKATQPLGQSYIYLWHANAQGESLTDAVIDPNNVAVDFNYDSNNNVASITDQLNKNIGFTYDASKNVTSVTNQLGYTSRYAYDSRFNRLSAKTDAKGNITSYSHDTQGNISTITNPDGSHIGMSYTAHGNVQSITDALNHTTTIGRDSYGRPTSITDALSRTSSLSYDTIGRMTAITNPANATYSYGYDTDDALLSRTDPLNNVTRYSYTPGLFGQQRLLSSLTDANNHTTNFGYDTKAHLASLTDPAGHTERYGYDNGGNLTSVTDNKGATFALSYNNLSKVVSVAAPDASISFSYDAASRMTSASDSAESLYFSYDAAGEVTAVGPLDSNLIIMPIAYASASGSGATSSSVRLARGMGYTYDANGNVLRKTLGNSYNWLYSYDSMNRPVLLTAQDGTLFSFTYDAAGRRTHMDMGTAIGADYGYDAANHLASITYKRKADNAIIASAAYTYDAAGNRTAMTDDFGAHSYGYDAASKLTSAIYPSSGPLSGLSETFSYDAVGNRTQDASVSGYAYGANNQLTGNSAYSYSYDANGNMTGRTRLADNASATFTYDSRNRMTSAAVENGEVFTFTYDVMGRRLSKTVVHNGNTLSSDYYIYDGADIIAVTDANRTVKTVYTHGLGIDEHLMMKKDTTDYFMLTDGLGSVIALTDQSGNIIERTQYQSYGTPVFENAVTGSTSAWSTTGNIYSYTGREWTAGLNLFYYRARYYDPNTGRFIQQDPAFLSNLKNQYTYAEDNPFIFTDPYGTDVYLVQYSILTYHHEAVFIGDQQNGYKVYEFEPAGILGGVGSILTGSDVKGLPVARNPRGQSDDPRIQHVLGHIVRSHDQDLNFMQQAQHYKHNSRWNEYNAYTNNCWNFAEGLYGQLSPEVQ